MTDASNKAIGPGREAADAGRPDCLTSDEINKLVSDGYEASPQQVNHLSRCRQCRTQLSGMLGPKGLSVPLHRAAAAAAAARRYGAHPAWRPGKVIGWVVVAALVVLPLVFWFGRETAPPEATQPQDPGSGSEEPEPRKKRHPTPPERDEPDDVDTEPSGDDLQVTAIERLTAGLEKIATAALKSGNDDQQENVVDEASKAYRRALLQGHRLRLLKVIGDIAEKTTSAKVCAYAMDELGGTRDHAAGEYLLAAVSKEYRTANRDLMAPAFRAVEQIGDANAGLALAKIIETTPRAEIARKAMRRVPLFRYHTDVRKDILTALLEKVPVAIGEPSTAPPGTAAAMNPPSEEELKLWGGLQRSLALTLNRFTRRDVRELRGWANLARAYHRSEEKLFR